MSKIPLPSTARQILKSQIGWSEARVASALERAQQRLLDASTRPDADGRLFKRIPRPIPAATPPPIPRTWSSRVLLRLPTGRVIPVRLNGVAERRDMIAIGRAAHANAVQQRQALAQQAGAIAELQQRLNSIEARLDAVGMQSDLALFVALRSAAPLEQALGQLRDQMKNHKESLEDLRTTTVSQRRLAAVQDKARAIKDAVSSMQVAAYGERGNVFAQNNLLLGGSEILWGVLHDTIQRIGPSVAGTLGSLTWLGPIVSLLLGHATLGQQQFEVSVSGELQLQLVPPGTGLALFALASTTSTPGLTFRTWNGRIDLKGHIAPGYLEEFRNHANVAVRVELLSIEVPNFSVGRVEQGILNVTAFVPNTIAAVRAHWTVDTGIQRD